MRDLEMKFTRRMVGITLRGRVRSETITSVLGVTPIMKRIKSYRKIGEKTLRTDGRKRETEEKTHQYLSLIFDKFHPSANRLAGLTWT